MPDNTNKTIWSLPLILFTVAHVSVILVTYGSMTTEMRAFNKTLSGVVTELRITNQSIQGLREKDIKLEMLQESAKRRIDKLEGKHP